MTKKIFISDLHLSDTHPLAVEGFLAFIEHCDPDNQLYILGDFFEYWIGDDDDSVFHRKIMDALKKATTRGLEIFIMHGNRDFMLGKRFCKETGCQLLDDPTVITLGGVPTLLMHGDTLCTQDTNYLAYRKKIRRPWVLFMIRRLPLWYRRKLAKRLRAHSADAVQNKAEYIMDVTQKEVEQVMQAHNVKILIHGHTHRPNVHYFSIDGQQVKRIVLGAWDHGHEVLYYQEFREHLSRFHLYPDT